MSGRMRYWGGGGSSASGLSTVERAAMALVRCGLHGRPKHIPRNQISTIRKMAHAGCSAQEALDVIGLDMSKNTFLRKCRELRIQFEPRRGKPLGAAGRSEEIAA